MGDSARPPKRASNPCFSCQQPVATEPLTSTKAILVCLAGLGCEKQENLIVFSVDSAGYLIKRRLVSLGTLTASLVHPREVFAGPIADRAAAVIMAHNYPSGVAEPSKEDITTTNQMVAASQILGLTLRDHIIVTRKGHFSFRENGFLDDFASTDSKLVRDYACGRRPDVRRSLITLQIRRTNSTTKKTGTTGSGERCVTKGTVRLQ